MRARGLNLNPQTQTHSETGDGLNRFLQYLLFDMSQSTDQEFLDRKEWRRWLEEKHSSEKEVWVIIYKKKSGRTGLKYQEAVEEAICFGWIDSKMQRIDAKRFRQRFSPRKKNSIWSKNNKETAEKMIQEAKMTQAGFETINEAKRNGKWDTAYSSKMVPTIPRDLAKALRENELAWKNFKKFSNSTKLQYIYWVNSAKKDETRRKRIIDVMKKAAQNIKPS
jgi:uncharacterized protein YdeI (YjbR/CyaY-like superfamily)